MYLSGWIRFWVIVSIPVMETLFYGHLYITFILIFCRVLDGVHRYLTREKFMDELLDDYDRIAHEEDLE
jgi:hypothetical protein